MYDSAQKKFVPANKDLISEEMISESGEVGKVIRLGADKTIHASVEQIDGVNFDLENISDTQLLAYNKKKGAVGKIIRVAANTPLNVDINGSASK